MVKITLSQIFVGRILNLDGPDRLKIGLVVGFSKQGDPQICTWSANSKRWSMPRVLRSTTHWALDESKLDRRRKAVVDAARASLTFVQGYGYKVEFRRGHRFIKTEPYTMPSPSFSRAKEVRVLQRVGGGVDVGITGGEPAKVSPATQDRISGAITKLAPVTLTAAAFTARPLSLPTRINDTLEISIEIRAPRAHEYGWWVKADATPEEMLREVIAGRDDIRDGVAGFGFRVDSDFYTHPDNEFDSVGQRCITVKVERVISMLEQVAALGRVDLGNPDHPDGRQRRRIAASLRNSRKD